MKIKNYENFFTQDFFSSEIKLKMLINYAENDQRILLYTNLINLTN
jgi:hypothetical protein